MKKAVYFSYVPPLSLYDEVKHQHSRPVATGLHGVARATPGEQDISLLPSMGVFAIFYCCFIFVAAKERFPEILVELFLGLCVTLESSIFSCTQIIHLILIT